MKEDSEQRASALKILSNFCKDPCAFYMLSTADSIVAACELLMAVNMTKPLSESECRHCVNIISTLSADACSRSKIRRCGALRKLVAMIRESHSQSERSSVRCFLYAIYNLRYIYSFDFLAFSHSEQLSIRQSEHGTVAVRGSGADASS